MAATAGWFQVANGSSWIQSGRRDTATRRFSTAGKIAEAKAEFKRYGFEEVCIVIVMPIQSPDLT